MKYLGPGINHTETGCLDISFSISDTSDCFNFLFFFDRWLQRISRILAVLGTHLFQTAFVLVDNKDLVLPRDSNMCTPPGLELFFFLHLFFCSRSPLCAAIVTVPVPHLKWQT